MYANTDRNILGIVGGMGPLASAEFLKTIYECNLLGEREQDAPAVIMFSDPTFPDRTDAFLAGNSAPLLRQLADSIERLLQAGASEVVLCCMTIHYLLPQLPSALRARVTSLVDVIYENLQSRPVKHLLICSTGTRRLRLFESHPRWPSAQSLVVMPDEDDQRRIHQNLIYPMKKPCQLAELFPLLESFLEKYGVDSFIAACSEVHVLAKHYAASRNDERYSCLDPLAIIAKEQAHAPARRI